MFDLIKNKNKIVWNYFLITFSVIFDRYLSVKYRSSYSTFSISKFVKTAEVEIKESFKLN